jgi:hypothetical protein
MPLASVPNALQFLIRQDALAAAGLVRELHSRGWRVFYEVPPLAEAEEDLDHDIGVVLL